MNVSPPGSPFVVSLDLLVFQNDELTSNSNPVLHTRIGPHHDQLVQGLKLKLVDELPLQTGQSDLNRANDRLSTGQLAFLSQSEFIVLLQFDIHLGMIQGDDAGHRVLEVIIHT